jgi:cytoskeletal protein RodZ
MSREDLAALTRIPVRSIERLEEGAFDRQADGFARGFVRAVAEALGLDVQEAVLRLLGEPADSAAEHRVSRLALRRFGVIGAGVAVLAVLCLAVWLLWTGVGAEGGRSVGDEVVYRHDAVRALAEQVRASEVSESLDSPRAEDPH